MSRIGKLPVKIPSGVKVALDTGSVRVEGPKGKLSMSIHPLITVAVEGDKVVCKRSSDERQDRALHGLTRALINNMVKGVTTGFERKLEIIGVGYQATMDGKNLKLTLGFSHPVILPLPEGVTVTLPDSTHIVVSGADRQKVGQFAANVRSSRKPEPYKGTGIRYEGEYVRRKAGKAFGSG